MPHSRFLFRIASLTLFLALGFFLIINNINQKITIQRQIVSLEAQVQKEVDDQESIINNIYNSTNEEIRRNYKDGSIIRINPQENQNLSELQKDE